MTEPIEPVTKEQLAALISAVRRAHGFVGLMVSGLVDADRAKGRRKVDASTYTMWTTDKKKITISTPPDGGLCVACSKTPDPDYPV